jgi:Ca-activated chloride channel family protein
MACTPEQLGADAFSDGGPYGGGNVAQFLLVDEPTLEGVAKATGGTYSPASDRAELQSVLAKLPGPRQTVTATETVEIAPALAALGALLLLGAVAIAIRQRRFP